MTTTLTTGQGSLNEICMTLAYITDQMLCIQFCLQDGLVWAAVKDVYRSRERSDGLFSNVVIYTLPMIHHSPFSASRFLGSGSSPAVVCCKDTGRGAGFKVPQSSEGKLPADQ